MKSDFASRQLGRVLAIAAVLALGSRTQAGDLSLPITGNLLGSVVDSVGTPQMGANVQLFNKYERVIGKTITAADGRFAFVGLPADLYSIRVSLASFLPASRGKIAVSAGLDSVLQVHLATLFSTVELRYTIPDGAMTNDWKWVLRSSPATRPITRYVDIGEPSTEKRPRVFSGTHAMLSMSGGDGGLIDSDSTLADFGAGFALSTDILGKNQLQVGGTLGSNLGVGPAAMGVAAIYSRSDTGGFGEPPEITMTMTQLQGVGPQIPGAQSPSSSGLGSAPTVRTMSLSIYEVADPLGGVHLEYGVTGESVDDMQHSSRISPFARVTVDAGKGAQLIAAYSDGARPDELSAHQQRPVPEIEDQHDDLIETVNTMARLPQLSKSDGQLELQRTGSYEVGYNKTAGRRTYAVSAFYEDVSNGRINVAGNLSALDPGDLMWDGMSTTSTYNIGSYKREGYVASVGQQVTDSLNVALAYGRMGGFTGNVAGLGPSDAAEQKFLHEGNHNIAAATLHAHVPRCGTKLSASYGWVDSGAVVPRHIFTTQSMYIAPGLNVEVRQPLPSFFGTPGHLEVMADLRNLLAQGYLPFDTAGGHTLLITQSPRAIRGGLNFTF